MIVSASSSAARSSLTCTERSCWRAVPRTAVAATSARHACATCVRDATGRDRYHAPLWRSTPRSGESPPQPATAAIAPPISAAVASRSTVRLGSYAAGAVRPPLRRARRPAAPRRRSPGPCRWPRSARRGLAARRPRAAVRGFFVGARDQLVARLPVVLLQEAGLHAEVHRLRVVGDDRDRRLLRLDRGAAAEAQADRRRVEEAEDLLVLGLLRARRVAPRVAPALLGADAQPPADLRVQPLRH